MADDDRVDTGQLETGLPIQGMSHLFADEEQDAGASGAPGSDAASTPANAQAEEVLDLDEFNRQFGNKKVKVKIAGEERILTPDEAFRFHQRYSGLERTTERKAQEASRVLDEIRQTASRIQADVSRQPAPGAQPAAPADPDDPTAFVRKHNQEFFDSTVKPHLERLERLITGMGTVLQPVIAEGQKKAAVRVLVKNGVNVKADEFETYHDKMVSHIESVTGRTLTDEDVSAIPAGTWAQAYLVVTHGQGAKANGAEPAPPARPAPQPRAVVTPAGGGASAGGGREPGETMSKLMKDARASGDWTKVLAARGVKPRPPGG